MIRVLAGPAYAGKSQVLRRVTAPGEVVIDTSTLWRALYPEASASRAAVRSNEQARYVNAGKRAFLDLAVRQGLDGWVTLASGAREVINRWAAAASGDPDNPADVLVFSPHDRATLEKRAAKDGPQCSAIVGRWFDHYEREGGDTIFDPAEFRAGGAEFRWATDPGADDGGVATMWTTADAELRADADRMVSGVVVEYGDEARFGDSGWSERFEPGSLTIPRDFNLTVQHDRSRPVGRPTFEDGPKRLRFKCRIAPGPRGDQCLMDIKSGLLRGASMEFFSKREGMDARCRVIQRARMSGLSIVDKPQYPRSRIQARAAQPSTPVEAAALAYWGGA